MSFIYIRERSIYVVFVVSSLAYWSSFAQQAAVAPSLSASQGETIQSVEAIEKMIDKGANAEALQNVSALLNRGPVPPGAYRVQGQAYYALNQFENAERAFERALVQDARDKEALQMRGLTLYRLGRPTEAIPVLRQAEQWGPRTKIDPTYLLALCYIDTRQYDDARHAFAEQYDFSPDSARAYLLTARFLLRRGFVPISEAFARKALELDAQLPEAHALLGEIALSKDDFQSSVSEFMKEQARNPLDPALYDRLGDTYIHMGNFQEANQWLQRAVLLEPNSTGPYILLGKLLIKEQQPANAVMYLEHASSMDTNNYMAHALLSQAYRAVGRAEDAVRESQTAQRLQEPSETKKQSMP